MAQRLVSFGTDGTVFNRGTPRHPAKLPVPATPAALPLLVMEGIRKEGRRGEGQARVALRGGRRPPAPGTGPAPPGPDC